MTVIVVICFVEWIYTVACCL